MNFFSTPFSPNFKPLITIFYSPDQNSQFTIITTKNMNSMKLVKITKEKKIIHEPRRQPGRKAASTQLAEPKQDEQVENSRSANL
jgi:hypothetical protein